MPVRKIGRDAGTGRFIPVLAARQRPVTSVVETFHVSRNGVWRFLGCTARAEETRSRTGSNAGRDL
jgi:hypothetical protein